MFYLNTHANRNIQEALNYWSILQFKSFITYVIWKSLPNIRIRYFYDAKRYVEQISYPCYGTQSDKNLKIKRFYVVQAHILTILKRVVLKIRRFFATPMVKCSLLFYVVDYFFISKIIIYMMPLKSTS